MFLHTQCFTRDFDKTTFVVKNLSTGLPYVALSGENSSEVGIYTFLLMHYLHLLYNADLNVNQFYHC